VKIPTWVETLPIPYGTKSFKDAYHIIGWSERPVCDMDPEPGRAEKEDLCARCVAVLKGRGYGVKRWRKR